MLKDITLSILHDVVMKAIKSSDCHSIIHQSSGEKKSTTELMNIWEVIPHQSLTKILFVTTGKFTMKLWIA